MLPLIKYVFETLAKWKRYFAPDVTSPRAIGEGLNLTKANSVKCVLLLLRFPYFLASLLLRAEWMKLVGNGSSYLNHMKKHHALAYQGKITYIVGKEYLLMSQHSSNVPSEEETK